MIPTSPAREGSGRRRNELIARLTCQARKIVSQPNISDNRLALERGRIYATILAPPQKFFVETPSALAVDLGCAYSLEVIDTGETILFVSPEPETRALARFMLERLGYRVLEARHALDADRGRRRGGPRQVD